MSIITKAVSFLTAVAIAVTGFIMRFTRNIIPGQGEVSPKVTTALDGTNKKLSIEEIVAVYNETVSAMSKKRVIKADSFVTVEKIETSLSVPVDSFVTAFNNSLNKSNQKQKIAPSAPLKASDILSAKAKESGRYIEIEMKAKNCKVSMAGSDKDSVIGRIGCGMGNGSDILKVMGVKLSDKADDSIAQYKNIRVYCLIDTEKKTIVNGEWSYDCDCSVKNAVITAMGMNEKTDINIYLDIINQI